MRLKTRIISVVLAVCVTNVTPLTNLALPVVYTEAEELTGVSNKKELNFAKYLSDNNKPLWIRQVLVPGYTDDKFDLQKLKAFINSLSNVEKVELLPYHNLGKFKWDEIGDKYELENVVPPSQEDIKKAEQILGI